MVTRSSRRSICLISALLRTCAAIYITDLPSITIPANKTKVRIQFPDDCMFSDLLHLACSCADSPYISRLSMQLRLCFATLPTYFQTGAQLLALYQTALHFQRYLNNLLYALIFLYLHTNRFVCGVNGTLDAGSHASSFQAP